MARGAILIIAVNGKKKNLTKNSDYLRILAVDADLISVAKNIAMGTIAKPNKKKWIK